PATASSGDGSPSRGRPPTSTGRSPHQPWNARRGVSVRALIPALAARRMGIGTLRDPGSSPTLLADRGSRRITSGLRKLPLSYAVLAEGRRCASTSAVYDNMQD